MCTKQHLPIVSKLCKFIPRTQWATPECWLLHLFLHWSTKTVLSVDFSSRSGKQNVSLRKHKSLMRLAVLKKGKMPPWVFHQSGDCNYSWFLRHKSCFHFRPWVLGSEKHFPTASELCKTLLEHTVSQETREECSVSASGIPVVTLSGKNYTVRWLCSINKLESVFSEKSRHFSKAAFIRKWKMNPCAFLSGLRLQSPCGQTKKYRFCY